MITNSKKEKPNRRGKWRNCFAICPQRWYAPQSILNDVFLTCHPLEPTKTLSSQSQKHKNKNIKQIPLTDHSNLYFHFWHGGMNHNNYYYYLTTCDITRLRFKWRTQLISFLFLHFYWGRKFNGDKYQTSSIILNRDDFIKCKHMPLTIGIWAKANRFQTRPIFFSHRESIWLLCLQMALISKWQAIKKNKQRMFV